MSASAERWLRSGGKSHSSGSAAGSAGLSGGGLAYARAEYGPEDEEEDFYGGAEEVDENAHGGSANALARAARMQAHARTPGMQSLSGWGAGPSERPAGRAPPPRPPHAARAPLRDAG